MRQEPFFPNKKVSYFFHRSKDEHMENGLTSVTLFAKLAREITFYKAGKKRTHVETLWFQIDDLKAEQLTKELSDLPNCLQRYELSENVFYHLLQLSKSCPNELYWITPYYLQAKRKMFLPWQELEQNWRKNHVNATGR